MTRNYQQRIKRTSIALAALILCTQTLKAAAVDQDGDGIADKAEVLLGTDPTQADTDGDGLNDLQDDQPALAKNSQPPSSAAAPFAIQEVLVENNYDYTTRRDAPDHLEVLVKNTGSTDLNQFSIYYTLTDLDSGKVESYFKPLTGWALPRGQEARIHFDQGTAPGHFRSNPNSLYRTSTSAKTFSVSLQAKGFAAQSATVQKDAGGAEEAD